MVNPLIQVEEEEPLPVWRGGGAQSLTYKILFTVLSSVYYSLVFTVFLVFVAGPKPSKHCAVFSLV